MSEYFRDRGRENLSSYFWSRESFAIETGETDDAVLLFLGTDLGAKEINSFVAKWSQGKKWLRPSWPEANAQRGLTTATPSRFAIWQSDTHIKMPLSSTHHSTCCFQIWRKKWRPICDSPTLAPFFSLPPLMPPPTDSRPVRRICYDIKSILNMS